MTIEALKNMYQLIASSLEEAQKKRDTKIHILDRKLSEGDSILLKDHTTSAWDLKCTRDYQIISFTTKTQVKMVDSKGKVKIVHMSDIKYVLPVDRVISKLPNYQSSDRQSKLRD